MIVFDLSCSKLHRFEGWFASQDAFADQLERGLVSCPVCGSREITRLPSKSHLKRQADQAEPEGSEQATALQAVRLTIEKALRSSENVGDRFPEEARRIHYQEAPARNIRGVATRREAEELIDEGIAVIQLPFPPSDEVH